MSEPLEALALPADVERRRHAALEVDGVPVSDSLHPRTPEALAALLAALGGAGLAVLARGAGSQLALGNPPRRADAFLSLEELAGIDELDAAEGVCRARAGTSLESLRARVNEAGWELPFDDAGRGGSLGGALATAALTPRAAGFGPPRARVLGLEVALADGSLTSCGGRVVKNVTGYDMAKLYLGSLGALGVVTAAWLRLAPRPESRAVLSGPPLADADACERAVAWSRGEALGSIALLDGEGGLVPWIELAGDAVTVEGELERLGREGLRAADPASSAAARSQRFGAPPGGCRFAVSWRPSKLSAGLAELRASGARVMLLPGSNLSIATYEAAASGAAAFDAAQRAASVAGGRALCEVAPAPLKRGRDVFGAPAGEAQLTRRLKERFDPRGTLNPGRFAGAV